jgi:phosphate transport system permease protein
MVATTTTSGAAVTSRPSSGAARLAEYARLKRRRKGRERAIERILLLAASVSVFTTLGIVYILLKESFAFFSHVPVWDFLTDTQWTPLFDDAHFGIMAAGIMGSSAVALLIAIDWERSS